MIVFSAPPRAFSAREQSLADHFRSQLEPLASRLGDNAVSVREQVLGRDRQQRAESRRRFRQRARVALKREAARQAPPCGLGVVELFILRWVIGQLLSWIMREWLEGNEGDDADQDD